MEDAFLKVFSSNLPVELWKGVEPLFQSLKTGLFQDILSGPSAQELFGGDDKPNADEAYLKHERDWNNFIFHRLNLCLKRQNVAPSQLDTTGALLVNCNIYLLIGYTALQAFVQANVTGPPLDFDVAALLFPPSIAGDRRKVKAIRQRLRESLSVDGIAAYTLMPYPELLCLADTIFASPTIKKNLPSSHWPRLRANVLHQRVLSELSLTLQEQIYENLEGIWHLIDAQNSGELRNSVPSTRTELHLEQAAINLLHGNDKASREDLDKAKKSTGFEYALTGKLGKRTKFQENEISQLILLAKSHYPNDAMNSSQDDTTYGKVHQGVGESRSAARKPEALDLDDDTLLPKVSFSKQDSNSAELHSDENVSRTLAELDPSKQPLLAPYDSINLLLRASSITNTSPVDGITREETMPYALRVLEGGSSNWQIYTQALLVRSRIEGYKSRTAERGLLQLQALVDQVIASTTSVYSQDRINQAPGNQATTFFRRPDDESNAPASERLRYVYCLSTPVRWELEAELASRWTQMGGLRSALDIYERLEMLPEAALCLAATGSEEEARRLIKSELCHPLDMSEEGFVDDTETWDGPERVPPPANASRMWCILADIDKNPNLWQKAWDVSGGRYARAQRSLGRYYYAAQEFETAAEAYALSLKVNQTNKTAWFAYGCCLLELARYEEAVEAFARTVQLDDGDAEAWSNLAAALVRRGPKKSPQNHTLQSDGDENGDTSDAEKVPNPEQHLRDALRAFKRAATLKQDSARIYSNVLAVAASLTPPSYSDIVASQRRIIELQAKNEGESCIDAEIVEALVRHVVATYPYSSFVKQENDSADATTMLQATHRPGSVPALVIDLVTKHMQPLITRSTRLWRVVATLAIWQNKPTTALDAHEKAWRNATTSNDFDTTGNEAKWQEVVQATLDVCDAYESLGPRDRTEGLGANSGEVVAKDWRFKARSAIRGILGRGKEHFDASDGSVQLQERLEQLKTS